MSMLWPIKRDGVSPHGFRSCFSDWASEVTKAETKVIEMALAHAIESKTEAAYRRGALLLKRRILMDEWAAFVSSTADAGGQAARAIVKSR